MCVWVLIRHLPSPNKPCLIYTWGLSLLTALSKEGKQNSNLRPLMVLYVYLEAQFQLIFLFFTIADYFYVKPSFVRFRICWKYTCLWGLHNPSYLTVQPGYFVGNLSCSLSKKLAYLVTVYFLIWPEKEIVNAQMSNDMIWNGSKCPHEVGLIWVSDDTHNNFFTFAVASLVLLSRSLS